MNGRFGATARWIGSSHVPKRAQGMRPTCNVAHEPQGAAAVRSRRRKTNEDRRIGGGYRRERDQKERDEERFLSHSAV